MNPAPTPPVPVKDKTIGRMLAFFVVISLVLVAVAVGSVRNIANSGLDSDRVNVTHATILDLSAVVSSLRVGEEAVLNFAMTGEVRNRVTYRESFSDVGEHLELAKAETRREPESHQAVLQLEALANQRAEFARSVFAAGQSGHPETVRALLAADAGSSTMTDVQRLADKATSEEMDVLRERDNASVLQARLTTWTVWTGVAVDILLLGGVAWLVGDDVKARRRAAAALQEANDQLEAKVRERTAELGASNTRLMAENLERRWGNQALEHQLRYNQLIINSINDLVFVLTKAMNISRINPAVVKETGFEAQDLVNRPFPSFARLAGAEAALVEPMGQALVEGHDLRNLPATIEDKRGRRIPVRLALFPLRDRDHVVGGVVILQIVQPVAPAQA